MADVIARAFISMPPHQMRRQIEQHDAMASLFEDVELRLTEDREAKGWRWRVTAPFPGSAEIWLEPALDGCVVHAFLRSDDPRAGLEHRGRRMRAELFAFKDRCESADS